MQGITSQFGIGESVTGQIGSVLQVLGHPGDQLLVLFDGVKHELGVQSVLDDAPPIFSALLQ
jgi:hypothetical protein